ncbi:O-antigen ligase family protein [Agrobacterium sp. MS2]|uniref:O-antigen ligase family protein n=1 Tax=Agrobacterium sp. MS2 TaxID=1345498 RepID=UPI000DBF6A19|nr:O-antigen ligase family protein [Agrobacterium sp. MS2]RAL97840.1 hypothetical protein DOU54_10355 [Agrobacterium sp. MS2]
MNIISKVISYETGASFLRKVRTTGPRHQLQFLIDVLFLAGLVFAMFLGGKITPLLIITGVVPIPFLLNRLKKDNISWSLMAVILPFFIYFSYNIFLFIFFTGLVPSDKRPVNPSYEFYIVAILMLLIGIIRGLQVQNLSKLVRYVIPAALLIAFIVLSVLMFFEVRDDCRVRGAASWPFIPALLFTSLTLLSYVGWSTFSVFEKRFRLALLACSIVVVYAYTASRGVAVGQVVAISLLLCMGMFSRFSHTVPRWHQIVMAVTGGIAVSAVVGLLTGCGPMTRILSVIDSAGMLVQVASNPRNDNIAPPVVAVEPLNHIDAVPPPRPTVVEKIGGKDQSIGLRLEMWGVSISSIEERPFFGHGALYLQKLITEQFGFEHNHNQYLSWLVTGGLVGMSIGLCFLATPWFVSAGLALPERMIITIAVTVVWGGAMMFDSFFNLKFYLHYYAFLCGVLYAWFTDLRNKQHGFWGRLK